MLLGIGRSAVLGLVAIAAFTVAACHCLSAVHKPAKAFRDCAQCPLMVRIPAGEFLMGAEGGEEGRPEGPPHRVAIRKAFAAGQLEVTQAQYADFAQATGRGATETGFCRRLQ